VARKYWQVVSFLWGDGKETYKEKKKVLGIHTEALPAMAMNTADGRVLTFDAAFEEVEIESWVRSYLGYNVVAATKGAERRADSPKPPKPVGGITGDAHADAFAEHTDSVVTLTTESFHGVVMDPHKDIMLILQAHDSEMSQEFYKYVKRSSDQFIAMGIETMVVAKFDVEKYVLPPHVPLQYTTLPAVAFFPAKDKELPYIYFTGRGKAQYIMRFAEEHASYKFELPEDPHLTPEQRVMKQEQLAEWAQHKYEDGMKAYDSHDYMGAATAFKQGLEVETVNEAEELLAKLRRGLEDASEQQKRVARELKSSKDANSEL
jgi:hypothetical protein